MILDAEKRGLLVPHQSGKDQLVVEGTAGNTGIGLAHICNARGYQCVIYMPNTQSKEKIHLLQYVSTNNYIDFSPLLFGPQWHFIRLSNLSNQSQKQFD